jgi:hypothetical protein
MRAGFGRKWDGVEYTMRRWLSFIYYTLMFLTMFFMWGVGKLIQLAPRPGDVNLFDGRFWLHNWSGALLGTVTVVLTFKRDRRKGREEAGKPAEAVEIKSFRLAPLNWKPAWSLQQAYTRGRLHPGILVFDFVFAFVIGGVWLMPHLPPHYLKALPLSDPRFWVTNWAGALLGIFLCGMRLLRREIQKDLRREADTAS